MIKYFKINELALDEIINLLEQGYHKAYHEDCGDYLMICLTNDNGNMKDEEIDDRIFDLELVDTEENEKLDKFLEKKQLEDVSELMNYVDYLEDIKKCYEEVKSQILKAANIVKDLY